MRSIRTAWYFLKCPFSIKVKTFITQKPPTRVLGIVGGDGDFANIGKYACEINNLEEKILKLCANLPLEDQQFVVRQVALSKNARETQNFVVHSLTHEEMDDLARLQREFFPNVFKITDDLYFYNGYFLPYSFVRINLFFYKHYLPQMFPPAVLAKMRQKDFIDVGGCIGDSALLFEKEFCEKSIYTFEPSSKNFALLERTLKLNNAKRIVPIKKGLGSKAETLTISYADGASSIAFDVSDDKENVEIITLDDFVAEHKIKVGFIKVDTEGFEQEFLKGAKNTICTQKPALLISIYHSGDDYFNIKPLIESWNLGYKMRIHKGTDGYLTGETALYCYLPD